ncbi:MAG: hypothetical protein IPP25_13585 [Saprospiraceae bacterium]|nr:hypothetical protein [Candidatus Opimibacter skivensis]
MKRSHLSAYRININIWKTPQLLFVSYRHWHNPIVAFRPVNTSRRYEKDLPMEYR